MEKQKSDCGAIFLQAEVRDIRLLIERESQERAKSRAKDEESNRDLIKKVEVLSDKLSTVMRAIAVGQVYGNALRYSVKSWTLEESYGGMGNPRAGENSI